MKVLEEKGILPEIKRYGGTSAGAINALFLALKMSLDEQKDILESLDFKRFMDDSWGVIRNIDRLVNKFGWHKGDFFTDWVGKQIERVLGTANVTFRELEESNHPALYVYGTNLSTGYGEIFSNEHTPTMRLADAVRTSMSIPLFFTAYRSARDDVDGGVLNNFPVRVFDRVKYIEELPDTCSALAGLETNPPGYTDASDRLKKARPGSSPYICNPQPLGFRLDSRKEIDVFRYGNEPAREKVSDLFDYIKVLVSTLMAGQENRHLESDDWKRTVYVDSKGVATTDFDIEDDTKTELLESGERCARDYFTWFEANLA